MTYSEFMWWMNHAVGPLLIALMVVSCFLALRERAAQDKARDDAANAEYDSWYFGDKQ